MEADLKQHLEGMETRLREQNKAELREHLHNVESRLREHIDGVEARLTEGIREAREHTETVETRLLNEFWKWGRTSEARYRQNSGIVTGLDVRVSILEDRVSELERGDAA